MRKSYFATESDYNFFGNGTLSKLLISFDCLIKGIWDGNNTELCNDVIEVFNSFRELGYSLYLYDVPEKEEILNWLDKTFDYDFTCNDYPTRYADLSDHWTQIMRNCEMDLCREGNKNYNRTICFSENWKEILEIIKENDILARTTHSANIYDDTDWNQPKERSGYIPVEKMNIKTTELLKQIAIPQTERPISFGFKPFNERWEAELIRWDVKEEIAKKYGAKIIIEQGSLKYRGTWIKVIVKVIDGTWEQLQEIVNQFCKDYGFNNRKEISFVFPYDLPWTEEQKEREKRNLV